MSKLILTIDYGYDCHSVEVSREEWEAALAGELISIKGQGFCVEGEMEEDVWIFNHAAPGDLHVGAEDNSEIFSGSISNVSIEVVKDERK